MGHKAAALVLLALISLQSAATDPSPQLASYSEVEIYQQGTISALGGNLKTIVLNLSLPRSTEYQAVRSGISSLSDSEGNSYLQIAVNSPPNPFTYSNR